MFSLASRARCRPPMGMHGEEWSAGIPSRQPPLTVLCLVLEIPDGLLYLGLSRATSHKDVYIEASGPWPTVYKLIGLDETTLRSDTETPGAQDDLACVLCAVPFAQPQYLPPLLSLRPGLYAPCSDCRHREDMYTFAVEKTLAHAEPQKCQFLAHGRTYQEYVINEAMVGGDGRCRCIYAGLGLTGCFPSPCRLAPFRQSNFAVFPRHLLPIGLPRYFRPASIGIDKRVGRRWDVRTEAGNCPANAAERCVGLALATWNGEA